MRKKLRLKRITEKNKNYFFGYYGKYPWSENRRYFVSLKTKFLDKHPSTKDKADIILFDLKKNIKKKIAETRAWNWQQGCMLQWIGPDLNSNIIYNDEKNGKFVSVILNIKTLEKKIIPYTIYDIEKNGKFALSIDYSRLNQVRKGYGYEKNNNKRIKEIAPKNKGVYLINLKTKKRKLLINLNHLYNYKNINSMDKGLHWIDQPTFSPNGKRFCFLHRWNIENKLFHTRFFTADLNGKNLFMFPDSGFYSHFCWKNSNEVLTWCSISEKFGNIRKGKRNSNFIIEKILPIYRKIIPKFIRKRILPIGYFLFKDQTKQIKKIKIHSEDGHPSFTKDEKYLITDTYPDKKHYRKLILYNWKKRKKKILGKFYSIPKEINNMNWDNSSLRCDLHPRWNFQGNKICFDSVHEGFRGIYEISL